VAITKLKSDYVERLGSQVAANGSYICYGLKQGHVRVLSKDTAMKALLKGHTATVSGGDLNLRPIAAQLLAALSAWYRTPCLRQKHDEGVRCLPAYEHMCLRQEVELWMRLTPQPAATVANQASVLAPACTSL
jgi:hypothetical protein